MGRNQGKLKLNPQIFSSCTDNSIEPLLITGFALWAAMSGVLVTWDRTTSVGSICGALAFGSIGAGLTSATGMMAAESAVSRSERAVVTGSRNFGELDIPCVGNCDY